MYDVMLPWNIIGSESSEISEKEVILKMASKSSEKVMNAIKISRKNSEKMKKSKDAKYFVIVEKITKNF